MCGLLFVCLGFYLLMSVTVFKSDKTQLVYDLNRSQVSNLASELNTKLKGISERLSIAAQLSSDKNMDMLSNLFGSDSDTIGLIVFDDSLKNVKQSHFNNDFLETYGLNQKEFQNQLMNQKFPFDKITKDGEAIWNASTQGAPPLIGFGKLVLVLDSNNVPVKQWMLVSFLKTDSFLKSVSLIQLSEIQISNSDGEVLVQKEAKQLIEKPNIKEQTLFKLAKKSQASNSVTRFEESGKQWLSAFAKAYNGHLYVTARAPENKVFSVVKALTIRTFLFGSIVLTLVILAAFLLSRSLTRNIAILSKRMANVSSGDLSTPIDLTGRDETVLLGNVFNQMIHDLRESRDELEVMNQELDQKVKDRTKELEVQNQKVAEAQEALLRTARLASMGEVAGKAAHEVLNPLTSLLTRAGLTQKRVEVNYQQPLELLDEIGDAWDTDYKSGGFDNLLQNWKEPSSIDPQKNLFIEDMDNINEIRSNLKKQADEIAKDMKFIREEGDRIGKIIHSMRRLGNMKSEVKTQSIHLLLSDCSYIMADLFDQQNIVIHKNFEATIDQVDIDRDEFIQAVTNLMRNSLQSIVEARLEQKKIKSELTLSTRENNGYLEICIQDNGVGISKENQQKLFNTNFTTKSSDEGTGLGLTISRRFIRNYDGDIQLEESVPFEKTVFLIKLPLKKLADGKAVA